MKFLSSETDGLIGDVEVDIHSLEKNISHDGEVHAAVLDAAITPRRAGFWRNRVIHEHAGDGELAPVICETEVKIGQGLIAMEYVRLIRFGVHSRLD